MPENEMTREIPEEIDNLCRKWLRIRSVWAALHYCLGTTATLCSITVAANPSFLSQLPGVVGTLAWISALCISLMTFLVPERMARGYIRAWRVLNVACQAYRHNPSADIKDLLRAVKRGEQLIARDSDT